MYLLTSTYLPLPASSIRNVLGDARKNLHAYVNKYDFNIPLLITEAGSIVSEAHAFLYEKHIYSRGSTSARTIETYAESLVDWFRYCENNRLAWNESTVRSIVMYRNSMKAAARNGKASLRVATINLRTTVVVEFMKYYLVTLRADESTARENANLLRKISTHKFKLRKAYARPIALSAKNCRSLHSRLNGGHKLIFKWAISTGLRISSVLSISLESFIDHQGDTEGRFIEVGVKGGKTLNVFLPKSLIEETNRYIRVERKILSLNTGHQEQKGRGLFLNRRGISINRRCYYAAYRRACTALSITSHPHQTRTTFATFMERALAESSKEKNLDRVKIIQGLLGHASSATTHAYLESISINDIDVLDMLDVNSDLLGGGNEQGV
jgi:integrase